MAKFVGKIGFATQVENPPGVYTEDIVEKTYTGDILRNNARWQSSDKLYDDFVITNNISIIGDPYATENLYSMKYVEWMGAKWKVESAEVEFPRIQLTLGERYHV